GGRRRVRAGQSRVVPVPTPHIGKKRRQVAIGNNLASRRAGENARRKNSHQADDLWTLAGVGRLVFWSQQAGLRQRRQIEVGPGVLVGGQHGQRLRSSRVAE